MEVDSLKIEGRLKTEYYLATVINTYRTAIDSCFENIDNYDYMEFLNELEKTKTRGLTTFYFNDRKNTDIQEYAGKQYNEAYQFGGKVIGYDEEKAIIDIRNRLQVGDEMEIIVPHKIEPVKFKIEKMWDIETEQEVETVHPGVKDQKVKMLLPIKCEENWIIRRKKGNGKKKFN